MIGQALLDIGIVGREQDGRAFLAQRLQVLPEQFTALRIHG